MGNRRRRQRSPSPSSSTSSSEGDCTDSVNKKRKHETSQDGNRSFTPELQPSIISDNTGMIEFINTLRREQRPKMGMSVKDADITEFNPLNDDINEWLAKIDEHAGIYMWDDLHTCHLAINKLKGPAETWYKSLPSIPKTWSEWKLLLTNIFPSTRDLHTLMAEMLALCPKPNQSLFEYCFEKLAVIRKMKLNLNGSDEVNLIVGGLNNHAIKFAVKAANIDDPSKLAAYLKAFEPLTSVVGAMDAKREKNLVTNTTYSKNRHSQSGDGYRQRNRDAILCFMCHQPGHKQINCPQHSNQGDKQAYCNYCRRKGHHIGNCFKKNKRNDDRAQAPSNNTELKGNKRVFLVSKCGEKNKFYKSLLIDKSTERCFIDFGSECSLITYELAKRLKLNLTELSNDIILTVFGGSEIPVSRKVTCSVTIDEVKLSIDLLVVEKCIPGVDIVVGQNFTEDPRIKYQRVGSALLFSYGLEVNAIEITNTQDIKIGIEDKEIQSRVLEVIQNFSSCFPNDPTTLGTIIGAEMKIRLKSETPIVQRPYRLSEAEKCKLRDLINELLSNGAIRPSHSPYASPVVMVRKKNGKTRLCVDYRLVNKETIKENYPLPIIEDLIDRLSGHKYFTVLDFRAGYHQISLAEDSIPITAFITPEGKYEYVRVPFGLTNAPYVFQRAVDSILDDLRFNKAIVYLDDILIPSKNLDEGIKNLKQVLRRLQDNGVCLNIAKCIFLAEEIEYLGYNIRGGNVQPSTSKLTAINEFPDPKNIHHVRQFLGLVGHFRKFVPDFAHKSKPLTKLLKKGQPWIWQPEQENSFKTLKESLVTAPILTLFDCNKETMLYTDASRLGIAGMLVQLDAGIEKVIGYYSKATSPTEQRYHSFELEAMAILKSVRRFRHYLVGIKFKIYTDCAAVRSAMNKKDLNHRIGRWILELQEYDFEVLHRPGPRMAHVDALSRNPTIENHHGVYASVLSEDDWLLTVQEADSEISSIRIILLSGDQNNNKDIFNNYDLRRGKVYRRTDHGNRIMLPKACRWQVLRFNHDDIGHFSLDKTFERIASKFWFPKMRKFIKKYVKSCINCMYHKAPSGKKPGYLHPIPKIPRPFHTIHVDHLGPFCKSKQNNTHVLVTVDAFTKFCFVKAVRNTKTKYVVQELNEIIKVFGAPKRIITDRGRSFTSKRFKDFNDERNIRHHLNAVGMPRGNGQVERYNKTILDSLSTMGADKSDDEWDENVMNIQLGLNNTLNRAITTTPSEALLGYRTGPHNFDSVEHDEDHIDVKKLRKNISDQIATDQLQQKTQFDLHRAKSLNLSVGELVLVKISSIVSTGTSRKLVPKWKGPFKVSKVLENDRYEVVDIPGSRRSRIPYSGVYAVEHIKRWVTFSDE